MLKSRQGLQTCAFTNTTKIEAETRREEDSSQFDKIRNTMINIVHEVNKTKKKLKMRTTISFPTIFGESLYPVP